MNPTPKDRKFLKVACFITRRNGASVELLVFKHPLAGIQLPAGSVEPEEAPSAAAEREIFEETGLRGVELLQPLSAMTVELPPKRRVLCKDVYLAPPCDEIATDLHPKVLRGHSITLVESVGSKALIRNEIYDYTQDPPIVISLAEGWTDSEHLSSTIERHFFLFDDKPITPPRWHHQADGNLLELFWYQNVCKLPGRAGILPALLAGETPALPGILYTF